MAKGVSVSLTDGILEPRRPDAEAQPTRLRENRTVLGIHTSGDPNFFSMRGSHTKGVFDRIEEHFVPGPDRVDSP